MDAAAPTPFGLKTSSAIAGFLENAIDVIKVAQTIQTAGSEAGLVSIDPKPRDLLAQLSKSVRATMRLRQDASKATKDAANVELLIACISVGRDISQQFLNTRPSFSVTHTSQIDAKVFCSIWKPEELATLSGQLREVIELCRRSHISASIVVDVPDALSRLSISDATKDGINSAQQGLSQTGPSMPANETAETNLRIDDKDNDKEQPMTNLAPVGLINDFLLENLAYKSMYDREEEVTEAHDQTLEWIFNSSTIDDSLRQNFTKEFTTWLKTNDMGPIYWITGKPGSGKSTLMAFLSQHPETRKLLQHWAGDRPVCSAGFFFWTSGTRDQRSQQGLLRSLLHQVLSKTPELIPSTFPDLWQKLRLMSTKERVNYSIEWPVPELMAAFHLLLESALPIMNVCLFVDGLDEFDGDHAGIVNFFKDLSTAKHRQALKMCLSSRPWNVFAEAFEQSVPNSRLQDLTYDDMHRYTRDELKSKSHIRKLFKGQPEFERKFVETAVQHADGVFLWVRLAVERICSFTHKTTTQNDLEVILESFPSELDDFFDKLIFKDQESAKVTESADLFQLICARESVADFVHDESSNALTAWELAFSFEDEDDDLALHRQVKEATIEEVVSRYQKTATRIKTCFSGLLSLHRRRRLGNLPVPRFTDPNSRAVIDLPFVHDKVTYIHRTVRDWLMNPAGAFDRLNQSTSPGFDAHLRLLRSYVLRLKHSLEEKIEHHRRLDEWYPDVALALSHARYITNDPKNLQRLFVNEMNKSLSWYWRSKPSDPFDHWARSTFSSYEIRMKAPPIQRPFLCLATKFGLTTYVCQELEDLAEPIHETEDSRKPTPLLSYATEFLCSRNKTIFPTSDPLLVEYLLKHPSQVNPGCDDEYSDFFTGGKRTPWLAVLRHLRDARRRGWIVRNDTDEEGVARWAKIMRLFIEVGRADVNTVVVADAWDPEITAVGVLNLVEEASDHDDVRRVRMLAEEVQKRT